MGTNQFLLIALCFMLIGASIRVGIDQYKATEIEQNRNALMDNMRKLSIDALLYRTKTVNIGGGGEGSYKGFKLSKKEKSDDAGTYKISVAKNKITLTSTSKFGFGTIKIAYDGNGKYVKKSLKYTGDFK